MRSLSGVAAISAFLGVVLIGHWAIIVALRFFRINVPFSLPFHFYTRRERELLVALKGRPMELYVFISGVLLFACPCLLELPPTTTLSVDILSIPHLTSITLQDQR